MIWIGILLIINSSLLWHLLSMMTPSGWLISGWIIKLNIARFKYLWIPSLQLGKLECICVQLWSSNHCTEWHTRITRTHTTSIELCVTWYSVIAFHYLTIRCWLQWLYVVVVTQLHGQCLPILINEWLTFTNSWYWWWGYSSADHLSFTIFSMQCQCIL